MARSWSSVSWYGKRAANSSYCPAGGSTGGRDFSARAAAILIAAQAVELRALVRAVARQQLDIFHGQEQFAAVILQFQAVMRRAQRIDRLEAQVTAHAMFNVGNQIARRQ
jgi:hypothetical protein